MKVTLERLHGAQFRGTNEAGQSIMLAGAPDIGPSDEGVRPMQALLLSLASCSSIDVLHILQKQHHRVDQLDVHVEAERADAVPAVFTKIHLRFVAAGDFPLHKLERAVALSADKYCSVSHMLRSTVAITHSAELGPGAMPVPLEPDLPLEPGA